MPATIADLDASRAAIKTTPSGLVEYNNGTSLEEVIELIRNLLAEGRVPTVADALALADVEGTEAVLAFMPNSGFWVYGLTDLGNGVQSVDGNWWNPDTSMTLLSLINGVPANGDVPVYDSGTGTFIPGPPTVSALGWANITSKPSQITGIATGEELIKQFPSGTNEQSIGTVARGDGNITLTPMGDALAAGTNSFVAATKNLAYMTSAVDSIIHTTMASLRPGTTPYTVARCIIIGDPGPLTAYFNVNALEDLIIIGSDGAPTYVKEANGQVTISGGTGGSPAVIFPDAVSMAGTLAANGNATVGGTLTVAGATAINDDTDIDGDLGVTGNTSIDGTLVVAGAMNIQLGMVADAAGTSTFNGPVVISDMQDLSFGVVPTYADNATALAAIGPNKLYRTGDGAFITH